VQQGGAAQGKGQNWQSQEDGRVTRSFSRAHGLEDSTAEGRVSRKYGDRDYSIGKHGIGADTHVGDNDDKVSLYVTNFPDVMSLFRLRQCFKVCGMLSDVYVARYQNVREQVFGFVRFVNVKNIEKLSQTLNNVWIGQCLIWAREARFDRFAQNDDEPRVSNTSLRQEEVVDKGT